MNRLLLPFLLIGALSAQTPAPAPPPSFATTVRPFLEKNCQGCHNAKLKSGEVNFELLKFSTSLGPQADTWEKTAYALKMGQMPPAGAPQPAKEEAQAVSAFLEGGLAKVAKPAVKAAPATPDWVTWQGDPERTGWARAETTLNTSNASKLTLLWKSQLDAAVLKSNVYSTLTDPLVVRNVQTRQGPRNMVYLASAEDNVYALDADTGAVVWERKFPNTNKPPQPPTNLCPNNVNANTVIDKESGIVYALTNDGKLRGLGLADGDERMAPADFVAPYSRNWSLNLVDNLIYTSTARGCGGATSVITAIDVKNPAHPLFRFYPSTGKGSGPWGRGGIVATPTGMVAQTADGVYDPASGRFGNTFLGLTRDLRLNDSYTPANEEFLNKKDLDLGSASPTVFPYEKWTLIAGSAKEGVIYLLDASDLGGLDHRTPLHVSPRYGNDAVTFGFTGVWGQVSTYLDAKGQRWVLVPMEGPPAKDTVGSFKSSYGPVGNGSVMAFIVKTEKGKPVLVPMWMSHDLDLPGMPVIANRVVYVVASGDRGADAYTGRGATPGPQAEGAPGRGGRGGRGGGGGGAGTAFNIDEPGAQRDAAWFTMQREPGGQVPGQRFKGANELTHTVLYALDAETGKELYSSGNLVDSWSHYGGIALSNGRIYLSTYDARVFAFGLPTEPRP